MPGILAELCPNTSGFVLLIAFLVIIFFFGDLKIESETKNDELKFSILDSIVWTMCFYWNQNSAHKGFSVLLITA